MVQRLTRSERMARDEAKPVLQDLNGTDLRSLRESIGWTQQHLADLLGVDVSSVRRWELGTRQITRAHARSARWLMESELRKEVAG